MRRRILTFLRDNRGVSIPFVAVSIILLLTAAGIVIDLGHIYVVKHELQNAADAGALAGARGLFVLNDPDNPQPATVTCDSACALALATVTSNKSGCQTLTIPNEDVKTGEVQYNATSKKWEFVVVACSNNTNAVQVTTRRTATVNGPVNLLFGKFWGKETQELNAKATAFLGYPKELPFGAGFPIAIGYQYVPKIVDERRPVTFSPDWGDTGGWHCFTSISSDANELKGYVDGSLPPPGCKMGDYITCLNGVAESVVNGAERMLKTYQQNGEPWIVYLPVIDATKMNQTREVLGFCAFEIEDVDKQTKAISGDALGMYTSPGGDISPTLPSPYTSLKSTVPKLIQ